MPFQLHSQLAADTHYITAVENCQVLLMNDARFPWLVLVPMENDIRELYDLNKPAQEQTYRAMLYTAELLAEHTHADKMNVAELGNQVPQLHIHIIPLKSAYSYSALGHLVILVRLCTSYVRLV